MSTVYNEVISCGSKGDIHNRDEISLYLCGKDINKFVHTRVCVHWRLIQLVNFTYVQTHIFTDY